MKNVTFKSLVAISALILSSVVACSKGGGGSSAATPATAACAVNAQGICTTGVGGSGYVGAGLWTGYLTISDATNFQAFAVQNRLCAFNGCAVQPNSTVRVSLVLNSPMVPSRGAFAVVFKNGYYSRRIRQSAQAYMNAGNNGFQLVSQTNIGWNFNQFGNGVVPVNYQGNVPVPMNYQMNQLQIVSTFVDATHHTLNTQLVFGGHVIATGQTIQIR